MRKRLIALAVYTLFWLFFFIVARLIFILAQTGEFPAYKIATLAGTFTHGFRMDLSTSCYFLVLPLLLILPNLWFTGKWYVTFIKIYSYTLIILSVCLIIGDAIVYSYWGFRVEFTIMEYLKTPKDAAASASNLQIILFILSVTAMSVFFIWLLNRIINRFFASFARVRLVIQAGLLFLVLFASLIIPIRGGVGVATLNAGSVYFSDELFPNHSAINVIWNFAHTGFYSKPKGNPYSFTDLSEAQKDFRKLTADTGDVRNVLKTSRPNVLLVILESFGNYLTDQPPGDSVVTPRFREYTKEGILFSNIYAAGSRTDKAIPALLSGYPNLPSVVVMREPRKTQTMPGIFKLLDSAGYKTSFWYGGDLNFANMNSFITTSALREKITMDNFDPADYNSKWGVHDDVLLSLLYDSLLKVKEPFGYAVLTLSSHEPFEVPMESVFKGKDVLSKFKNSIYYADKSLGEFLDKAKKTEWWDNTLIILIADHCRRNTEKVPLYSEEIFRIPMLWIGGALAVKDIRIDKFGCQFDLPKTLASQLQLKSNFRFGKDLLSSGSNSFSFYTFSEGFAFITDTAAAIYDVKLKGNVLERGSNPGSADKLGKSFLQVLFDDYLHR